MEALATDAGTIPATRRRRAVRRRRIVLGATVALAVAGAAGVGLAGAADPSLEDKIDAANSDAGQLSDRIDAQTSRIASLDLQARQAGARAMELNAEVQRAEARSDELSTELTAAERQLDRLRAQYDEAVADLDRRLVAIYESEAPDGVTVLLNSDGFDDLSTRADYLQALHDADLRIADRVASLRDQVADRTHQIADLKRDVDAQAATLAANREEFEASEAAANQAADAVAGARAANQSDLADVQGQIEDLQAEQAALQSSGAPAYLGGPYAIPTYIVMCESGGNYHALNASSGAGGAYQILPSTWRTYGGEGAPQDAPKAEQDRIAAMIWRDSGPSAWACA
jgi:peptidoglycan hydrolase CwlO-like protein